MVKNTSDMLVERSISWVDEGIRLYIPKIHYELTGKNTWPRG